MLLSDKLYDKCIELRGLYKENTLESRKKAFMGVLSVIMEEVEKFRLHALTYDSNREKEEKDFERLCNIWDNVAERLNKEGTPFIAKGGLRRALESSENQE